MRRSDINNQDTYRSTLVLSKSSFSIKFAPAIATVEWSGVPPGLRMSSSYFFHESEKWEIMSKIGTHKHPFARTLTSCGGLCGMMAQGQEFADFHVLTSEEREALWRHSPAGKLQSAVCLCGTQR